jgi:hypothetical protein
MAQTYVTSHESIIAVSLAGVTFPTVKSWATFQGGDKSAATSQLLPGGLIASVAMPGPPTRTNVTVTLPYSMEIHAILTDIEAAVNHAMTASYTPTDVDGNPNDETITRTGLLKEPQIPTWDAKSGEPVFLGLVMEVNG